MSVLSGKAGFLAAVLNVMALSAVSTPLAALEFDRGEALYENHCEECHDGLAHTRKGSQINSMGDLRSWVASWSAHSRLGWSSEDVDDVVEYLNNRFYHLTDKP